MRHLKPLILAMALAGSATVGAAELPVEVAQALQQMQERLDRLEARNAELERQQAGQPATALETRVKQLESANAKLEEAVTSDRLSQDEPEIATRLKAVEFQAISNAEAGAHDRVARGHHRGRVIHHRRAARRRRRHRHGRRGSQWNYRADVSVSLPAGEIGNAEGKMFAHFRMGQGDGLTNVLNTFGGVNASGFRVQGARPESDATVLLAQAWYQLDVPLPVGGFKPRSRETLTFNFGKMDPFLFFDQNTVADDETTRFLNHGFRAQPAARRRRRRGCGRLRLHSGTAARLPQTTTASPLAGAPRSACSAPAAARTFTDSLREAVRHRPVETAQRFFGGLAGNYRLYVWRNGRATHLDGVTLEAQSGWGVSADQRLGDGITLWGRYGHGAQGNPAFDQALTLGAEFSGNYWGRGADGVGLAVGWLAASDSYKTANPALSGAEQLAELYYRWRVNPQFELSPDYQFIRRAGADGSADDAHILGLRAQLTF